MMKPDPSYAPMYCAMYPEMAKLVRKHGYALAVHGSLSTDFDLICIPWIEKPSKPLEVVKELIEIFAFRHIEKVGDKPHGRTVYTLSLGFGHCYVDLGFMATINEGAIGA